MISMSASSTTVTTVSAEDERDISLTVLVSQAVRGDDVAWRALVHRLERVVWKAVNMATSDPGMREEAFAETWAALARRLPEIREPEKLPGWLTTTAVNAVRSMARLASVRPTESLEKMAAVGYEPSHQDSDAMVASDVRQAVRDAFAGLRPECRQLLTLVVTSDPPLNYADAAAALGLPVGSVGPTRQRCLDALRKSPVMQQLTREGVE